MNRPLPLEFLESEYRINFQLKYNKGEENQCWIWFGATSGHPTHKYPMIGCRMSTYNGNRVAYFQATGKDPGKFDVLHTCDEPLCVNPKHLFLGTQSDNMRDCQSKGRMPSFKGTSNGRSKLTENEVQEIRDLYSTRRFNQKELAKKYGVAPQLISRIIRKDCWKHL